MREINNWVKSANTLLGTLAPYTVDPFVGIKKDIEDKLAAFAKATADIPDPKELASE